MPGIISGLLSVLFSWLASKKLYGPSLYLIFPQAAPSEDDEAWTKVHEDLDTIEVGVKSNEKLCRQIFFTYIISSYIRSLRNYGNSDFNLRWSINQCPNPL